MSGKDFLPLPNIDTDETRKAIDDVISAVCKLPDLGILRETLAREPILAGTLDRLFGDAETEDSEEEN